ncbi:MAG TPA: rhombosortase [Albitalea sp.]|uniref:rhombosortase n=1 Tax=Piscinibacter sp. TaxID=1903157 RepID=UPI002ED01401
MAESARAWLALAAVLATGALAGTGIASEAIDWQPAWAAAQPWRAFSAVFVHYSHLHLAANLAGAVLVGALGRAARVPPRCALAWLAAWPLTQLGLLLQPQLRHYGGLSGVLHAGVAVVAVHLVSTGQARRIGVALLAGLVLKVLGESPWDGPLAHPAGWDIAVAPLAHASGLVAGLACALIAEAIAHRAYHRSP